MRGKVEAKKLSFALDEANDADNTVKKPNPKSLVTMQSILAKQKRPMIKGNSTILTGSPSRSPNTVTKAKTQVADHQKRKNEASAKKAKASGWDVDEDEIANAFDDFDVDVIMQKIRDQTAILEIQQERDEFLLFYDKLKQETLQGR